MTLSPADLRGGIAFVLAALVALLVGVLMSTPTSTVAIGLIGVLSFLLSLPLLLRWHRPLLFLSWNAAIQLFVLPGSPRLWMVLAGLSLLVTVLSSTLDRRIRMQHVPMVTWTLLGFLGVVLFTAAMRGGIGIKALGAQTYGGKKYVFIIAAVVGYFALSALRVPVEKAFRYMAAFCLGTVTLAMSNVAYVLGPAFYWLYLLFPVEFAMEQASSDFFGGPFRRLSGIGFAMVGPFCLMLMSYGIRGLLDWRRPWRMVVFVSIIAVSLLGGFRSMIALYVLLFAFQFWIEGLWRTRYAVGLLLVILLTGAALVPLARELPLTMQRSISFLPLDVDAGARHDAEMSTDWRLQMWRLLWAQVPQYMWVGKGFALDPTDLHFVQESLRRGFIQSYEGTMISGEFHSGPLSLLIGFGIPGSVTFIAFLFAGWRVVRHNHLNGSPELRAINIFIHACYLCRVCFFFGVYGDVGLDLAYFTGLVGASVALNGDGRTPVSAPAPVAAPAPVTQPQPA
jgi:hypothetical protein